jgi:predicted enzyme related to lactoylglutathione lyase
MNESTTPEFGKFCWNELLTNDPKKAKEFYGALLGWKAHDMDVGDMVYTLFKTADKDICGMMQIPKGEEKDIPVHWMSYIQVESIDKSVKKAEELGATITVPGTDVGDFGRFAVIMDPTGAHVAFWQSLKSCS